MLRSNRVYINDLWCVNTKLTSKKEEAIHVYVQVEHQTTSKKEEAIHKKETQKLKNG